MARLSEVEKVRIRRALGYVGTSESTAYAFGRISSVEYLTLANARMEADFSSEFIELIREDLGRCEATVDQMFKAQKHLQARKVGNIETNPEEIAQLREQWEFWAARLADSLGLPRYPHAHASAGGGLNARVC